MEALKTAIDSFTTGQLRPLGITVVVLALVVVGFCLIGGTRQMIDWAKNHIFHIIGGTILIYLATDIATSFITTLGGF
jgi:type IV secretory pathway VirB2 component (pilin)